MTKQSSDTTIPTLDGATLVYRAAHIVRTVGPVQSCQRQDTLHLLGSWLHDAVWNDVDQAHDKFPLIVCFASNAYRAVDDVRGLEVSLARPYGSLCRLGQNQLIQSQISNSTPKLLILFLNLREFLELIRTHSTVLLAPIARQAIAKQMDYTSNVKLTNTVIRGT